MKSAPPSIKLTKSLKSDEFKAVLSYYRETTFKKTKRDYENEEDFSLKSMNFISQNNECEVWQMIEITMKEQLQTYKTTIKADERKLKANLDENLKNCIEIRLGEKKILDFYLNMAKNLIECFSGNKRITDYKQYEQYLREVFNSESSSE